MIDQTDLEIINLLKENSRLQWREIGERVHLTGQAVANRIRRMEEQGLISGYTVIIDNSKLGKPILAFVTIYMKTTDHQSFHQFVKENGLISAADRISGEGCYLLKVVASSHEELMVLLDQLLKFGNHRVNLSIGSLK